MIDIILFLVEKSKKKKRSSMTRLELAIFGLGGHCHTIRPHGQFSSIKEIHISIIDRIRKYETVHWEEKIVIFY